MVFGPSIVNNDISNATQTFSLKKKVSNDWVSVKSLFCFNSDCCIEFYPENGIEYKIDYTNLDINYTGTESISILYYSENLSNQFLKGAGNRINRIGYFNTNIDKNYFINNSSAVSPIKLINYDYNIPNNLNKSSGSLVYVKPEFQTEREFSIATACNPFQTVIFLSFSYISVSSGNIYSNIKTHGADVGYKFVSVSQSNLGKTDFEYYSPFDFPEQIDISPNLDHIPSKNIDYKRGLLLKETIKNNSNQIITQNINQYEFENYEQQTGLKILKSFIDLKFQGSHFEDRFINLKYRFDNNHDYIASYGQNSLYITSPIAFHNGNPLVERNYYIRPIFEAYGWAKLTNKTTKNYFYPSGSSTPKIVETNETYTYNPINKKISESTLNNSQGEILTTKYFYHTGNSIYSQNRIAEIEHIETYKGSELLSKSKIIYDNTWANNVSYLPKTIVSAKGTNAFENRLLYNQYDEYGNPIEIQQEGGITIVYIWGYNKTLPIAKIENATYAEVQAYESNLQNISNTGTEANLIAALNNLRTALPNAMVSTYTHKPLIGISTATDPKGDTQLYFYDNFNRLQFVKDAQGNILSENEYHYKN